LAKSTTKGIRNKSTPGLATKKPTAAEEEKINMLR
jgi:hypothetical protein